MAVELVIWDKSKAKFLTSLATSIKDSFSKN